MTSSPNELTIVIPNYRGREVLPACLASLEGQTFNKFRLVIVHNDPTEIPTEYIDPSRYSFPIQLIISPEPLGFARATNIGIRAADTIWVFLLNNDAVLATDCLEKLIQTAVSHPDGAAFSALILNEDGTVIESAGDELTLFGWAYQYMSGVDYGATQLVPRECFSACAAAAMYRTGSIMDVGLFNEEFYSYLEDVELSIRLRLTGWKVYFNPDCRCYHIGGWAHGQAMRSSTVSSMYVRNRKTIFAWIRVIAGWQYHVLSPVRAVFVLFQNRRLKVPSRESMGLKLIPQRNHSSYSGVRAALWVSTKRAVIHVYYKFMGRYNYSRQKRWGQNK